MSKATADALIEELGGTRDVAHALGVKLPTVSTWRRYGIPPSRWPDVVGLAKRKRRAEVTFEMLAALPREVRA